jgi:hypothetical protein
MAARNCREQGLNTDSLFKPLLPNEPRIRNQAAQAALTEQHLSPVLDELEAWLLSVRIQLDPELERLQPTKHGKPYPLGQCLEIALAVQQRLQAADASKPPKDAYVGQRAFSAFRRAGGVFRQVWGDLRGQYFQNAFQLGTLYVDVSNDTVVPTKPKVEILPFEQANFHPIADYAHFGLIASRYWQDDVYPNHVLPALAPHCPLIHVSKVGGRIKVHSGNQYMLALTHAGRFEPSEAVLRIAPMSAEVFERVCHALEDSAHLLANNPEQGRLQALRHCHLYRTKRWHLQPDRTLKVIESVQDVNLRLARWRPHAKRMPHVSNTPNSPTHPPIHPLEKPHMATIKIDDREYDIDKLPPEAKAQLDMVVATENKLRELQRDTLITQTARNAYLAALKAALPTPLEETLAMGETLKLG